MIKGYLWYNPEQERYGIVGEDTWEHEGLHCGECFEVKSSNKWIPVRIEFSDTEKHAINHGWYLVGYDYNLKGLNVRM